MSGLCRAVFLWPFDVSGGQDFKLDLWLPVDDFRRAGDFADLTAQPLTPSRANLDFWQTKLDTTGMQVKLPPVVDHLWAQYRSSRADLLILADDGAIHPGPTIYDSFWIRDSSVEAVACSLAGDDGLASSQLGRRHLEVFQTGTNRIGRAAAYGFFGGEHEQNGQEWDANGEALWAFGTFDRIQGPSIAFGSKVYWPLVVRRVQRLNPKAAHGQGELFDTWRHHAFVTNSTLTAIDADETHRDHAIIEQVIAELKSGPLAHAPSVICSGLAGVHDV